MSVYVSIGNSDDKLSQKEWARFVAAVDVTLRTGATEMHGRWLSRPDDPFQNACWCFEPFSARVPAMKRILSGYAKEFRQDSIAWAEAETVFLEAQSE